MTAVKPVPAGFVVHTESTTSILSAPTVGLATVNNADNPAVTPPVFLNPVQQYNRDLSIVAIRTWSEERRKDKERKWEEGVRRNWDKRKRKAEKKRAQEAVDGAEDADAESGSAKRRKTEDGQVPGGEAAASNGVEAEAVPSNEDAKLEPTLTPPVFKFTCLEALSATGLRAIRYAKELPLLRYVVANDLSSSAVEDIRRNIEYNDLLPPGLPTPPEPISSDILPDAAMPSSEPKLSKAQIEDLTLGKIRPNEGDACTVMYTHRTEGTRFDCVDLDPYGSAVPFLDAAIGATADGGLLCVTCTDAGVLAGHNYPEKAYTHYGGICVNAEYCHEVGLRLILNAIATTAARYGRSIEPLVSLSIDFYMRVFVRIQTSPREVKMLPSKTSILYYCHDCQTPHFQAMGKVTERASGKSETVNISHGIPSGPPLGVGERCDECGGKFQIGGPMWSAPIHNAPFVRKMLDHVAENGKDFGTSARIEGMLSVAHDELDTPLYFTPARLAGLFHCVAPPLATVVSALLNAGYSVSRSHCSAGSLKTTAPRSFVLDILREWIKTNPVKMDNIKDGSPAKRLLAKPQKAEVDLKPNKGTEDALLSKVKLVRYQVNPEANWGPGRAAARGAARAQPAAK